MYEVRLNVSLLDNIPNVKIEVEDKSAIKENISKNQIKNSLGDVFLSDFSTDKDSLDKVHGFYITRKILTSSRVIENSFVNISNLNENNKVFFEFNDDRNIIDLDIPSIESLAKQYKSITYNVVYFNFSSNLINKSRIKIEEDIIYNYYRKYKKSLSSSLTKKIADSIKENNFVNDISREFYNAYSKSSAEQTITLESLQTSNSFTSINFKSNLIFNQKSYICQLFDSNINRFNIDLKSLKIFSKNKVIKEATYEKNKVKPLILEKSAYFNILSKESYDSIKSTAKNFEIKVSYRVYNINSSDIISTKELIFFM